ncbi:hypothetical protein [Marisediminicola sp. LYQ85]|uniref:hypothetical protein n=1 Tax=Marisediminicola sp. LYQ85 TaxID=3391062 RepID=UPI003983A76E
MSFLTEYMVESPPGSGLFALVVPLGWHTVESAADEWEDAPTNEDSLFALLESAREQCEAFAPAIKPGALIPIRYRQAQLMQARALWQSTQANASDEIGSDGFRVTVFPMDRTIKNLLRPKRGVPLVG